MGRPGVRGLHRRTLRRRRARPQRTASEPLLGDARRFGRDGIGVGRAADRARACTLQRPLAAGTHVPRRYRGRAHRRGRGDQGDDLEAPSLPQVARREPDPHRRVAGAEGGPRNGLRYLARTPAHLRLHARRRAPVDRADVREGPGAVGLDGSGHSARLPLGPAATPVQLFQAALRPGHQPGDRSDPRRARHVDDGLRRRGRQPARRITRTRARSEAAATDSHQPRVGEAARGRRAGFGGVRQRPRRSRRRQAGASASVRERSTRCSRPKTGPRVYRRRSTSCASGPRTPPARATAC